MAAGQQPASQKRARAGAAAEFLTLFAVVWNAIVLTLLLPKSGPPLWFKGVFVLAGAGVALAAALNWRARLLGGSARLQLQRDPVPHGIPFVARFELNRPVAATQWHVEAVIESSARNQSGFGQLWSQRFPAQVSGGIQVSAEVVLPADLPSTGASDREAIYEVRLILRADAAQWAFNLSTCPAATAEAAAAGLQQIQNIGRATSKVTPEQAARTRHTVTWIGCLLMVATVIYHASRYFEWQLWQQAQTLVGTGAYSTPANTTEFELRADPEEAKVWAVQGQLEGPVRAQDDALVVRVDALEIAHTGSCGQGPPACEVASVRLLLTRTGGKNFTVLAQSQTLPVHANLRDQPRWSLPPAQRGAELRIPVPKGLPGTDSVDLKLEIRMTDGTTVYPGHGPTPALRRLLTRMAGS